MTMNKKLLVTGMISIGLFQQSGAQDIVSTDTLGLNNAIALALSKNHNIVIAKQQDAVQQKNVSLGNAGFLPKVDVVAQKSLTQSVTDMEFNSPTFPVIEDQEAGSTSDLAQVQLSYLLFNGGGRLRGYQKLKKSGELSEIQKKISIESSVIQVVNAYYEVVRQKAAVNLSHEQLDLSRKRMLRAQKHYQLGSSSQIQFLNAQVDYNADRSDSTLNHLNLIKAKHQLNFLLGREIETGFEVESYHEAAPFDSLSKYSERAQLVNSNLLLAAVNLRISELDHKINKSTLMPVVSTNFNYGYAGSSSDVGVVKANSSLGFTGSLSLTWNLFDGFKRKHALEQSKILMEMNEEKRVQAQRNLDLELQNYYASMTTYLRLIELEKKNITVAQQNLKRSTTLYENGSITSIELRQAQLNLFRLKTKLNNYTYMSKVFEYQLLRLSDQLF